MPIRLSDLGNKFKNDLKKNMVRMIEENILPSSSRELLFNGDIKIGQAVLVEDQKWEIIDVRTNYVVLVNQAGEIKNKFVDDLTPINEQIKFPLNTFKGIKVSPELAPLFNQTPTDIVCCIRGLQAYSREDYSEANKCFERSGMITEDRKLQALALLASALDVKLLHSDDVKAGVEKIQAKLKKVNLNAEQKQVLDSIVKTLRKQGIEL